MGNRVDSAAEGEIKYSAINIQSLIYVEVQFPDTFQCLRNSDAFIFTDMLGRFLKFRQQLFERSRVI